MRPWSERELATLEILADAFVPGTDAPARARRAASALEGGLDQAQVTQLRLVLRAMDSRLLGIALAGRPARLADLDRPARERYVLGLAASRIPQRRAAIGGIRRLLTFLAYADVSRPEVAARLAAADYRPDRPPVAAEPTAIRAWPLPPAGTDGETKVEADVVVVGAGAGGGAVAAALTGAGRSVVVLEAGPLATEPDLPRDEIEAYDRHHLAHGLSGTWDGSTTLLAGAGVGGGTLVNWMTSLPTPPRVRDEWAREHGIDWAAAPGWALEEAAVLARYGVADPAVAGPKDEVLLRGAAELGWSASANPRNAARCSDCGSCGFGCPRGTKHSTLRVDLAEAFAGGARIVPGTTVDRVRIVGGRVDGVDAVVGGVGSPPRPLVVRAPVVVVTAGALRTPAVLQRSGLAHPAIGRHLHIHPVPAVGGRYDEPTPMWRGPLQAARCMEFADPGPGREGYVIESAPGHPGLAAQTIPWDGAAAHAALMADIARFAPLIAVTRDGGEGRVRATRSGGVGVDYRLDRTGVATLRHALVSMARMHRAAGAREIVALGSPGTWFRREQGDAAFAAFLGSLERRDFGPHRATMFSAHQMSSVRMGADPRTHPCDPDGRVRAADRSDRVVAGLYVADGSLFPTALGVNPMITVFVVARRVAAGILADT